MPEEDPRYKVGYAKPPKEGQFMAGKSGNPKGRPRGSKNLSSIVSKESRQLVRVNGPSGSRTVTKLQAAVMQLSNKSAQGDLRALRDFFELVRRAEEDANSSAAPDMLHEIDKQVIKNLHRRMQSFQTNNQELSTEVSND